MNITNPFAILLVTTFVLMITFGAFAILAPAFVAENQLPASPEFPQLALIDQRGNVTAEWAFNETLNIYYNQQTIFYSFAPDKRIYWTDEWFTTDQFRVQRWNNIVWADEPVFNEEGIDVRRGLENGLNPTTIANSAGKVYLIDPNTIYEAYVTFAPLDGYTSLADSWNLAGGFKANVYGNSYATPDVWAQASNLLGWLGSIIWFFVLYIAYVAQMLGVLLTVASSGVIPSAAGGAIAVLLGTLFIGSLLMFLRGSSGGNTK